MLQSRHLARSLPLVATFAVSALLSACGGGSGSSGASAAPDAVSLGVSTVTTASATADSSTTAVLADTTATTASATTAASPADASATPASAMAEILSSKKFFDTTRPTSLPVVTPTIETAPQPINGSIRKLVPMPAKPASLMPAITLASIPAAGSSFSGARRMAAYIANAGQVPVPSDIGAFREVCSYSHMSFNDPIVYPGQTGASHLHVFFGNTGTDANSTATSLATTGNSTCAGGTLNRTAYWVPAMIDTATNAPVTPSTSLFYYKTGYNGVAPSAVQAIPAGLRMITGDSSSTAPSWVAHYACVGNGPDQTWHSGIPNCIVGDDVVMALDFPQCWDGVNLDSPDHKSHMAYSQAPTGCPADHPVPLPLISFQIHYTVTVANSTTAWRLSSDNYDKSLPGGYSGHGDWFGGWDRDVMATFIRNCDDLSMDCHAYLLGDGTTLY